MHASWYRSTDSIVDNLDKWGRPFPDPKRWPSSVDGVGFKDVAQRVHRMGLKFGIHVMGGISKKVESGYYPILDITTVCINVTSFSYMI